MMTAFLLLCAALATAPEPPAPQAEVTNVRFPSPRLMVVKAKHGSSTFIRGPVRVDMSFRRAQVKCPVLKVTCLCDIDGRLTCYSGLWDRLNTNTKLNRSDVMASFREAGFTPDAKDRGSAYSDPALVSGKMCCEVAKEKYAGASYGATSQNGGLFRIGESGSNPRLLLFRFELWQFGVLAGSFESSRTGLGKLDIPEDWHVWRKYPRKFTYVDN